MNLPILKKIFNIPVYNFIKNLYSYVEKHYINYKKKLNIDKKYLYPSHGYGLRELV